VALREGEQDRERVRPTVWLAAMAIVLACAAFAILIAQWIERGGIAEVARNIAERASSEGTLGPRPQVAEADLDGGTSFAWPLDVHATGAVDPSEDPQLAASHRSFGVEDAALPPPFRETWARGHLASVSGAPEMHRGDECWVRVLPVMGGAYNCLVRITCDDVVVYPDSVERAGYAPCDVDEGRVLSGRDESPSGRDGDPTLELDLRRGRVEVTDAVPAMDDPYASYPDPDSRPPRDFAVSIVLDAPRA
jgi:hypothetical protein